VPSPEKDDKGVQTCNLDLVEDMLRKRYRAIEGLMKQRKKSRRYRQHSFIMFLLIIGVASKFNRQKEGHFLRQLQDSSNEHKLLLHIAFGPSFEQIPNKRLW
jgi:hypothetical protein